MIAAHLPALQVVGPLLAAPLCLLARRGGLAWALCLATCWAALAMSLALALQVNASGPISYALGDWAAPWGIEYRLDIVNAFVLVIVSAIETSMYWPWPVLFRCHNALIMLNAMIVPTR